MAETVMKFGPEWLRVLSDGGTNVNSSSNSNNSNANNNVNNSAPPKYKLAEHRYGREEMLSLYTENTTICDELKDCQEIFSERCQSPVSLIPMSEEEHRTWARCVNSELVIRLAGKNGNNNNTNSLNERERLPERGNNARGRGVGTTGSTTVGNGNNSLNAVGPNERGRGRVRSLQNYQRGISYEEEGENSERRDFRAIKSFDERPFNRSDANDESNRIKKDTRSLDNWRSSDRGGRNDDRSWRNRNRQDEGRSRASSWRADERDRENEEREYRNGPSNKKSFHMKNSNDQWEDWDDDDRRSGLPEWSLDDSLTSEAKVGTFDSSGAFREDVLENDRKKEPDTDNKKESSPPDNESTQKNEKINDSGHHKTKQKQSSEIGNNNQIKEKETLHISDKINEPSYEDKKSESLNKLSSSPLQSTDLESSTSEKIINENITEPSTQMKHEEDNFAQIETMVAQWTAEEEESLNQRTSNKLMVLPLHHEDAYKWFYRDPQGDLQGPFSPQEMFEWFSMGYFTMDLLVRRGCDEMFSQLGELMKTWNRVPFLHGQNPPPIRASSNSPPLASSIPVTQMTTPNNLQLRILQQQQLQKQMILNQHMQMQNELRQLLATLKQQEGFTELSQQQQQEVLVQHYVQQRNRTGNIPQVIAMDQQTIQQPQQQAPPQPQQLPSQLPPSAALHPNNPMMPLVVPMMRPVVPPSNPSVQQMPLTPSQPPTLWDLNGATGVITASALEEMHRHEQERIEAEEKKKFEEEQLRKKIEEENQRRILIELQKKMEEERKLKEEYLKQEEERLKKEEEDRLRLEEEERRIKEQQRRQEEIKRLEEISRKKREEEKELERRRREVEEAERIRQHQELEKQRQFEMEMAISKKEQEEAMKRMQEQKKAWGAQQLQQQNINQNTVSLAEIQRIQEQKEREERQVHLQRMQNFFHAQQMQQQQQQMQQGKQQLTWANTNRNHTPVKTLAEIQKEESERAAKQKQADENKQAQQSSIIGAGIWNNAASQLSWKPSNIPWETSTSSTTPNQMVNTNNKPTNQITTAGFWDNEASSAGANRKVTPTSKSKESALQQSNKNNTNKTNCKHNSSFRATKEEEEVMKLFENQRKPKNDEFTNWCKEALEKFQKFVDVPTFIAFLKDVESPYEVSEYVISYLGESKETRDFAKMFIDKRSYYRNLAKKAESEEAVWCPPPPATPSAKKSVTVSSSGGDSDSTTGHLKAAAKKKKKGKKMVDASILGFTVQADPDRVNVGEIEKVND